MLNWLRTAVALVLLFTSVFLGAIFAAQNTTLVPLSLFVVRFTEQTLAVWFLCFMVFGVLIGSLICSIVSLKQRAGLISLRRENARLKQRIERQSSNG